jgi:PAS domain S-box-containing protein
MANFSNESDFRRSEEDVLKILDEAPVGIIRFNADGRIDYVNPAFSKMGNFYHLKTSSLLGTNIFEDEIIPDISFTKETAELREGYIFEKVVKNLKTVDGSEISIIIKGSPLFEENNFTGGVLVIEDLMLAAEAKEDLFLKLTTLQNIIKETVDLVFIIDKNGNIKHTAGNKLNLILKKNIKEAKIQELIPNLPSDFNQRIADVLSKTGEIIFEAELKIGDEELLYECKISPLPEKQKTPRYLSCIFKDITPRKKSEEQIEELKLFKTAAKTISDGLFTINTNGILTTWYSSAEVFTGYSIEETLGKPIWDFFPLLNEESFEQLEKDLQQLKYIKKQTPINKKSGQTVLTEASFFRENNEDILIAFFSVSKHREIEFKALEENFRNLVTQSNEIIIRLDPVGNIQYVNPAFTSLLHFTEEEAIGKSLSEFIDTSQRIIKDPLKLFEQKTKDVELQLISKSGSPVNFISDIIPLKKEDTLTGYNIYLFDFSEKKKEESGLRFFKSLFENIREGIAIESNGKIIIANDSFSKLFGYSSGKELTGKDVLDLVSTGDALKVAEYLQHKHSNVETPGSFEFIGKKKDGAKFNSEIVLSSFGAEGKSFIILINRDITERRRALQSIRESEEKYRSLIENIDDFLYAFEKKGTLFKPVFYTASVEKITGYTQAEMLRDLKQLFKIIHPDDFAHVKENLKNLIRSKTRISIEIEFRIINKHGNMIWVRNKITSVRDENGEVRKIFGLVSDVTLRKKSESDLQKSTQNLMKLNETKDKFISIISHDLRTPFSSILGFTDLMLNDETLTNDEKDQYVRYIQESSNAMLSLVNSLLNWTRLQTGRIHFEPERVRASQIIAKSVQALAGTAFQKKITISSTVPDDIYIFVDQDLIAQVFNNLISNAIKFTKENGGITITAKPSSHLRFYEFSVKDTGAGIKPEDQEKLFGVDNKFTTEGTAGEKGTGLGLSLVKEIIEKHDGTIRVESEFEKGSDFIFTLPVAAANILLVDPKITDKILYSKILKHITPDYSVETASDGKEALEKIISSTYALIITEHKTQEMTGYELALELKKLDMKVKPPIIVLSSSVDRQTVDDYNEIGVNYVFQKPVDLSSFKNAVEKSLRQTLTNS